MIGAQVGPYLQKGEWQTNASIRQFETDQEYQGTGLRQDLMSKGTQVKEGMWFLDLQATYAVSPQLNLTLDAPVILRAHWSTVIAGTRYDETSRGLFDMMLDARYWLFKCANHTDQNISVGLGVRMPTGNANATALFPNSLGHNLAARPVFTGIQTGSGAWGLALSLEGFKQFRYFTVFGTGNYLFSLRGQNNTLSFGAAINPLGPTAVAANVRYNSTPDSYLVHTGVAVPIHRVKGLALLFGGRVEGVPVHNVFGPTTGFRQPGYYVTVEPGINFDTHVATYSLTVPLRAYQNVENSLGFKRNSDFAHHMLVFGVSFNLVGNRKPAAEAAGP